MKPRFLCWTSLWGLAVVVASSAASAATVEVGIQNFAFVPRDITINVGDTVRWTQRDTVAHTATSDTGVWDSGYLSRNQEYSFTFTSAGTYPYYCIPHPHMTGTVTVQEISVVIPPTVAIVIPTNGATFASGDPISIEAQAQDSDGTVAQVEFFDGTNSLGVELTSPYGLTVTLAPGSHVLTAVATDNQAATGASAPVTVTVSSIPVSDPFPLPIAKGDVAIELETVVDGLASPLGMAVPADGSGRMFVYDQIGLVWIVEATGKRLEPLLDVRNRLVPLGVYDERGLLGLAVHPGFATNQLLYTYTSEPTAGAADFPTMLPAGAANNHQSVLAEWRIAAADTNRVDMASRREILRIDQPQSNHNGGALHFGPDGYLYLALGDGGAADDQGDGHMPEGNGQDLEMILGKLIRIDVGGSNAVNGRYGVPADNPWVGLPGLDEIYAYGFRNPFSFSFDPLTGDLHIADVGQNKIEEINRVTRGGNYGWNLKEGSLYFDPNGTGAGYVTTTPVRPVPEGLVDPIAEYDHDEGLAVVGGYVYRGSRLPQLAGRYVFGDWGSFSTPSGRLFYLDATGVIVELRLGPQDRPLGLWVKGMGQDTEGELYLFAARSLGPAGDSGQVLKLVPAPDPIQITAAADPATGPAANWSGGQGPFALQMKENLDDPIWQNVWFSDEPSDAGSAAIGAGFFRVADAAQLSVLPLTVFLSSELEVPEPVGTGALGEGIMRLEGNTLRMDLRYQGLSGPATGAHLHGPARVFQTTNVIVDIKPLHVGAFGTQGAFSGSVMLTDAQKAHVLAGRTYVNIHTENHPAGEMRGQVAPVMMQALLGGHREHPAPVASAAHGLGTFLLVGTNLSFNLTFSGLSAPATAAHIHGPATALESADVMVDLAPFPDGSFGTAGSLTGTIGMTPQQLAWVIDGLTYVNFLTPTHPEGEMRGQILPQVTAVPLTAWLSGAFERPTPVTNSANGSATLGLEGDTLAFNLRYRGLSSPAVAAHLRGPATTSQSADVLHDLAPFNGGAFGTEGALSGTLRLTAQQRLWLLNGQTYVSLQTAEYPGGELRGQITPVLMRTHLSGSNERPSPAASLASGTGAFALVWNQLSLCVTYRDLLSAATASHIHGPASAFQTANVLVDLAPFHSGTFGASGSLAGTVTLVETNLAHLVSGATYLNVHTTNYPGGEVRGQIVH